MGIAETHVWRSNIEKIFDPTVFFGKTGKFWNGEDDPVHIRIVPKANLLYVTQRRAKSRCNGLVRRSAAVRFNRLARRVKKINVRWRGAVRPGVENERG